MARKYSQEELNFIINNYKTMSNSEMGKKLKITKESISQKLKRMELKKSPEDIKNIYDKNRPGKKYTRKEKDFLINNYKTMSNQEIGKILNLSREAIRSKLRRWGLKKSSEDIKRNYQENKFKCAHYGIEHPLYGKSRSNELKKKLREMYLGKSWEELHGNRKAEKMKKNASLNMSLEKNPAWLGGKSFEPYTKNFNKKFKKAVKERDGCCILCNIDFEDLKLLKRQIHIHHINYDKELSIKENCCSLCNKCHIKTNSNRPHWIKFFQSLLSERYGYQYNEKGTIIINSLDINKIEAS